MPAFAADIVRLGGELEQAAHGWIPGRPVRLRVGLLDETPKALAARPIEPAFDAAPVLLPTPRAAFQRALDTWFVAEGIRPMLVSETDDGALLAADAARGRGAFEVPSVVADTARRDLGAVVVGAPSSTRERLFSVTAGRRRDPTVAAVLGDPVRRLA